jgi:hypothetical protein
MEVNLENVESGADFHRHFYGGAGYEGDGFIYDKENPQLLLLGDSHALQYAHGIYEVLGKQDGIRSYSIAGTSCFHLLGLIRSTKGHDWEKLCTKKIKKALELVKVAPSLKAVLLTHQWNYQIDLTQQPLKPSNIIEAVKNFALKIAPVDLIVLGGVPEPGVFLHDLFMRPLSYKANEGFYKRDISEIDPRLIQINQALEDLSKDVGNIIYIDPFDYLCSNGACRHLDEQKRLLYSDDDHLSKDGSIYMIRKIRNILLETLIDER